MRGEFFAPTQSNTLNIADLARVLLANVWQIACVTVTVVIATLLYAYSETPLYQGTATILLEPRLNRAVHLREVYDPGVETDSYYATQVEILRSRHLAQRVVDKLGLNRFDESAQPTQDVPPAVTTSWNQWLPRSVAEFIGFPVPPSQEISRTAQSVNRSAVNELTRETHVEPVPRTQLLRVHYLSASPQEAARRANALADAYIEIGLESRLEASRRATAWLTGKLDELRVSLEKAERGLQQFREREQLVDVGGVRALVEEELLDNSRRLREAQKTTNALAATYAQVRQAGTDPARLEQIGDLIRLPLVENAKKAVVSAQENYKQLRQRYGEKHPLIAEAQTRLDSAQKTFRDQLLLAADNLRSEYEVAKQSQDAMGASVALAKSRIRDLDRKQYEFGVLQREVTSNQQLYNVFLSSFKETDSSSSFEPINARVLQVAEVPTKPVYPDYRLLTIKSAAAGLVLALLLVALRQMLDESIGSADELEAMADLSVMGVLPKAGGIGLRRNLVQHFVNEPRTAFAEGIRSLTMLIAVTAKCW
jgi:polysaccharide biosynthesis transport protein